MGTEQVGFCSVLMLKQAPHKQSFFYNNALWRYMSCPIIGEPYEHIVCCSPVYWWMPLLVQFYRYVSWMKQIFFYVHVSSALISLQVQFKGPVSQQKINNVFVFQTEGTSVAYLFCWWKLHLLRNWRLYLDVCWYYVLYILVNAGHHFFMVALCNRADHIYFHAVVCSSSSSSFFYFLA